MRKGQAKKEIYCISSFGHPRSIFKLQAPEKKSGPIGQSFCIRPVGDTDVPMAGIKEDVK